MNSHLKVLISLLLVSEIINLNFTFCNISDVNIHSYVLYISEYKRTLVQYDETVTKEKEFNLRNVSYSVSVSVNKYDDGIIKLYDILWDKSLITHLVIN